MITVTNQERDPNDLRGVQVGGSYKIVRMLGAGGMGRVWLARASQLDDKEAAVKVLSAEALSKPEHLLRFKAEVRVVGGLKTKSVVEIFDAGELPDGRFYMIMEFCSGGSLASLLEEKGRLSVEETFIFLAGPAKALRAAHAQNIIHRDVKPDNILLVAEGDEDGTRAKLGDFGIAKLNSERFAAQFKTGTMRMMGTVGYMAPEQMNPREGVSHRADIFSFGCVLYLCLTGKLPYPAGNVYEYCQAIWPNQVHPVRPRRPSEHRSDVAPDLDALVMDCLEIAPHRRPQSVEEVMRRFAFAIPNGQALLQVFAGSAFVDRTTAPTANTISETLGVAATQIVSAMSRAGSAKPRRAVRRAPVAFVAGALLGGAAAIAAAQSWSQGAIDCGPAVAGAPAVPVPAPRPMTAGTAAGIAPTPAASDPAPPATLTPVGAPPSSPRQPPAATPAIATSSAGLGSTTAPRPRPAEKDKRPQQIAGQGTLHVEVQPWADVVVGDWQDTTPVTRPLPAGHQRILLRKGKRTEVVDVVIVPNQTTTITRSW